ncbi:hypothetical protein NDU88_004160 [Pleurodeles waltl]|uniref:ribonuclease H n=1 Tax=Pleurodeles waltl TaxID=8319 RepID=A0AAV7WR63_PLEWA|nr:hypothetical protein NDU88_004160 [Pleurodeles waltl]
MIARTKGMNWFTTIDLTSAYHEVVLHRESRRLTAFVTPFGCYQFTRVPFGLASAAAMFQRLMFKLFQELQDVMFFQDDILVMGKTRKEHDSTLEKVLDIIAVKGLTADMTKCNVAKNKVTYLGHEISVKGVEPKSELVEAIKKAPIPTNKDEVRAFLGLAEFYAKYVKNFSSKTYPIRQLLKNKVTFEWSNECQAVFDMIKQNIIKAPALQGFDHNLQTIVTTDASNKGLGAVLAQVDACGNENVIAFASRSLTETEMRYSVIERETLACVWGLEHFRQFIWGMKVILRSDHKPLIKGGDVLYCARVLALIARAATRLGMKECVYLRMLGTVV